MRFLLALAIATGVAGCSTGAQIEAARMVKTARTTVAESKSCLGAAYSKPDYAKLKTKLFLNTDTVQVPLEYLTDHSKPTKAEIADLYKLHADIQDCRKIALDGMAAVHPLIVAAMVESFSASDKLWADTASSGNVTWGKFNEARQGIAVQLQGKLTQPLAQ
jgi:hypothetical protein